MHDALKKEISNLRSAPEIRGGPQARLQRPPRCCRAIAALRPIVFVKNGEGKSRIHDIRWNNEYVDHKPLFWRGDAGHCHPAVVKALLEQKLHMKARHSQPHDREWELAEEGQFAASDIPVEMVCDSDRVVRKSPACVRHRSRRHRVATKTWQFEGAIKRMQTRATRQRQTQGY